MWASRTLPLTTGARARVDFTLSETGMVMGRVTQAAGSPLTEPASRFEAEPRK